MATIRNLMLRIGLEVDGSSTSKIDGLNGKLSVTEKQINQVNEAARRHQKAMEQVGTIALGVGGALVAGFGAAIGATMKFDKAMSNVGAVSNASSKELDGLRKAALQAGKDTVFSATQAAEAESELAKVGISAADIMGGALTGSLSLAAAGQLGLEEAATLAGQAMKIFNLQGKDVGKVADVLAAGANKSAADVHQLGESLRAGGQTASSFGLNMVQTVGVLAAFSDNALIGSDAGTSLKTMLLHLANPTAKTSALMEDLGIAAYDTGGNFVGMGNLAQQLKTKLGGLTQEERDHAIAQIFGSDAMRGATILYKLGAKGVEDYTKAVDENGAAAKVAATNLDNLSGDLEKLKGSIETALIQGGSSATGVLRGLTQAAGGTVDLFNQMPSAVQGTVTVVGGLVGVLTAVSGAFVLGAPKVAAFKDSLASMGPRGQMFGKAITGIGSFLTGPWGIALGIATVGLGIFAAKHAEAEQRVQELTATLDKQTGAITADTRAKVVNAAQTDGLLQKAKDLGINVETFTNALLGSAPDIAAVNRQLEATATVMVTVGGRGVSAGGQWRTLSGDATKLRDAINGQNSELADSVTAFKLTKEAMGGTAKATTPVADGNMKIAESAGIAAQKTDDLSKALNHLNKLTGDADLANIAFREDIDRFTKSIVQGNNGVNKRTGLFDLDTKRGRENNRMLIELIQSAGEHSKKILDETQSVKKANKSFGDEIVQIRGVLEKMHLSKSAIDTLIGKYVEMGRKINSTTGGLKDHTVKITVKADGTIAYSGPNGKKSLQFAGGGVLPGYTPGRDVHDFYSASGGRLALSGGEAVMRPEFTKGVGASWVDQMNQLAKSGGPEAVKRALGTVGTNGPHNMKPGGEGLFFAGGGIISKGSVTGLSSVQKVVSKANSGYKKFADDIGRDFAKWVSEHAGVGGPAVQKALRWAKGQAGKPYIWGGVGPRGYDCSGFMSAITNVIHGKRPYSRLFTTHSFGSKSGPGGFVRNLSSGFKVGVTDAGVGHMAGTLGKSNVESRGSRGVLVGSSARGSSNGLFSRRYGLKMDNGGVIPAHSVTPVYNGTSKPEYAIPHRFLNKGDGDTVNITINAGLGTNPRDLENAVYEAMKKYKNRNGRSLSV